MHHIRLLVTAALTTALTTALATVLVPAGRAAAESASSCHGHRATVVGTPGGAATGTSGRDVIVTNGAHHVLARAGDDLICVDRAPKDEVVIDVGAGDDTTWVDDRHAHVRYDSGRGSDTYRSAGASDIVVLRDDGRDYVSTGKRVDVVTVEHDGPPGTPRVRLGGRGDVLLLREGASRGTFDGGGDGDVLFFRHRSQQPWTIDNQKQRASAGTDVRFRWRGFDWFRLSALRVPELRFIGSDADEWVDGSTSRARLDLAGGGGDDHLYGGRRDDRLDGGPGTDTVSGGAGTDSCLNAEQAEQCESE